MTITWGNTVFSEPELLSSWNPPFRAALYAIMMRPDSVGNPTSFRILYFGESGNLSDRGFGTHHKRDCWIEHAGGLDNVYVGLHFMPDSTEEQRCNLETALKNQYAPDCND